MKKAHHIRWEQRLANYAKALRQLTAAVKLFTTRGLSDLEKQGLIQAFEVTHELLNQTLHLSGSLTSIILPIKATPTLPDRVMQFVSHFQKE